MLNLDIAVAADQLDNGAEAEKLAARLDLPLARANHQYQLLLRCDKAGLELVKSGDPNLAGPVRVDFTTGQSAFRRQQQKRELLVRAAGVKNISPPAVIDGTGGLGRDCFILATAGCRVHIFEQHPIIAALLADGLKRARHHQDTAKIARRIQLTTGDTVTALLAMQQTGRTTDVVYLDPMFPARRKSARVKKELQILQMLAVNSTSHEQLFKAALATAADRVVVKRPRKALPLTSFSPSHSLTGKTVRFDVYITGLKQ